MSGPEELDWRGLYMKIKAAEFIEIISSWYKVLIRKSNAFHA